MLPHSALESGRYFSKAYLEFCNLNAAVLAPCGGAGGGAARYLQISFFQIWLTERGTGSDDGRAKLQMILAQSAYKDGKMHSSSNQRILKL
jgi:hypothetical protein